MAELVRTKRVFPRDLSDRIEFVKTWMPSAKWMCTHPTCFQAPSCRKRYPVRNWEKRKEPSHWHHADGVREHQRQFPDHEIIEV